MKKLTKLFSILLFSIITVGIFLGTTVHASSICDIDCKGETSCLQMKAANGCTNIGDTTVDTLPSVIVNILQAVIGIAGLVSVVFIIIGGISYITSTGDAGKVKKAKDTILYALIGLIICALAFVIVTFVIGGILTQGATEDGSADDTGYILIEENYPG